MKSLPRFYVSLHRKKENYVIGFESFSTIW